MKKINLYFLDSPANHGGVLTAVIHHYRGFESQGYEVTLYRVGKSDRSVDAFPGGLRARFVSPEGAVQAASKGIPGVVMYAYQQPRRQPDSFAVEKLGYVPLELARELLIRGALFMIHSVWEIGDHEVEVLRSVGIPSPAVVGRHRYKEVLTEQGIDSTVIPLMFNRSGHTTTSQVHAVSQTRIAAGKNIDVIVAANDLIGRESRQIRIYGLLARHYVFRTLEPAYRHWKRYYCGEFNHGDCPARMARFVVDMTFGNTFSMDGGGPQMTFLEAWDVGAQLVIHQNWLRSGPDDVHEAYVVGGPESLAQTMLMEPDEDIIRAGYVRLLNHVPETTVPMFERLFAERGFK